MNLHRLGYFVSFFSYLFFLTLEYLRPGFVMNYLSVHLLLLPLIAFGVMWYRQKAADDTRFVFFVLTFSCSLLFSLFTWREGRAFEDYRPLMTVAAFSIPWLVRARLRHEVDRS